MALSSSWADSLGSAVCHYNTQNDSRNETGAHCRVSGEDKRAYRVESHDCSPNVAQSPAHVRLPGTDQPWELQGCRCALIGKAVRRSRRPVNNIVDPATVQPAARPADATGTRLIFTIGALAALLGSSCSVPALPSPAQDMMVAVPANAVRHNISLPSHSFL
ncbi:hypothetical protein T310_5340 [Rasamsonia emersonii CBS 393.64]|uniref:Uncharacterized protein n=1 Tax=Rasamsonia emersonii (strain ATCC 16479 / CBS 393.64 / IMI 116815) TaxID=1408163 RepID=A0A0F4YRY2_RASE3|nr:hypothetical protein T310_5340 [Rasamsonia emersonii CBS 393.64]KKA20611.1 hypothetical protein T310_5340 [Rasamsonia emersonii CBS 393.64]